MRGYSHLETLFPNEPIPWFLLYVKDRDLWNKSLAGCDAMHEVISRLGKSFDLYDQLLAWDGLDTDTLNTKILTLAELGDVLLAPKKREIKEIAQFAVLSTFLGHENVAVIPLDTDGTQDRLTSDICEYLYTEVFPDCLFVACQTSEGTWSLRSNKNNPDGGFNVGALAKTQGGGGHNCAAGFKPTR